MTGGSARQDERKVPLRVEGLTKRFGSDTVVSGVDFELPPGAVTAMIGPNGAGKSTVINMLSGTLLPTGGQIWIADRRVDGWHAHEIAGLGVARTFQTPKLFDGMTALETVMVARDRYSRSGVFRCALKSPRSRREEEEARRTSLAWLDFMGLADVADMIAASLPVGTQRLVEVARALAADPDVVLLDEPAAGLDHSETHELAQHVQKVAAMGPAVLLVEHDMRMVMSIADSIIVLDGGRKIAEGTPAEVGRNPDVVTAYLGVVHR